MPPDYLPGAAAAHATFRLDEAAVCVIKTKAGPGLTAAARFKTATVISGWNSLMGNRLARVASSFAAKAFNRKVRKGTAKIAKMYFS